MKSSYLFSILVLILPSSLRDASEHGYITLSGWILACMILTLVIILFLVLLKLYTRKNTGEKLLIMDSPLKNVVDIGWYLGGFPGSGTTIIPSVIYSKLGKLYICERIESQTLSESESKEIPLEDINNISVEDAFSFKYKIAPQTGLLPDEFTSYLHGKKESDIAFVLIKWKRNFENYCTSFCIEGPWAMERAINKRNELKKICNINELSAFES